MCSPRSTCLIVDQLFCISMVSTDKHLSVHFLKSLYCFANTFINSFHCFDGSFLYACMSNHIRVCKVDHDHIIFVRFNRIYQFLANLRCTHFRLKIVGCNLRRFNQNSVFSFVRLFHTAVEEKCNMCIFLCFSNTRLSHIVCCKILTKCIMKLNLVECNLFILNGVIVICEAYESNLWSCFSFKSLEIIIAECSCDLTSAVRTEIKEYNRIFIRYNTCRLSVFLDNCRKNKLICLIIIIGSLNCCRGICSFYAFS